MLPRLVSIPLLDTAAMAPAAAVVVAMGRPNDDVPPPTTTFCMGCTRLTAIFLPLSVVTDIGAAALLLRGGNGCDDDNDASSLMSGGDMGNVGGDIGLVTSDARLGVGLMGDACTVDDSWRRRCVSL